MNPITALSLAVFLAPTLAAAQSVRTPAQQNIKPAVARALQPSARIAAEAIGCRIIPGDQVAFTGRPTKHMKDLRRLAPPEKVRAIKVTDMWIVNKGRYKGQVACRLEIQEWRGSVIGTSVRASNLRRLMP
jgi:hypothetical protein